MMHWPARIAVVEVAPPDGFNESGIEQPPAACH